MYIFDWVPRFNKKCEDHITCLKNVKILLRAAGGDHRWCLSLCHQLSLGSDRLPRRQDGTLLVRAASMSVLVKLQSPPRLLYIPIKNCCNCLKIESYCSNVHGPWSVVCYTYSWFSWIPCAIIHYPSSLPLPLFMTLPLAHAVSSVQISFHRQPLLAFNPMWSVWQQCKQPIKQQ